MKAIITLIILVLMSSSGCLDFETGGDDQKESSPEDSAFVREQKIKELDLIIDALKWENSRLSLKLENVDGEALVLDKKTGLWHYDVDRKPFTGRATELFANGFPRGEADFLNGRKDGMERFWWENGKLKEEGQWFNGMANGIFKKWHNNGQLYKINRYKNAELIEVILDGN